MNCTVWKCKYCGDTNHILTNPCAKCGKPYGTEREIPKSSELNLICRIYEKCDGECESCQHEVNLKLESLAELREFRDSL